MYQKVIFCNVPMLKNYDVLENNDKLLENSIEENEISNVSLNFHNDNGYYKGFVETNNNEIDIKRIDPNCNSDSLDDVLVVWVADNLNGKKSIIGYYNHAKVYRHLQKRNNEVEGGYYFETKVIDSKLLNVSERFEYDKDCFDFISNNLGYFDIEEYQNKLAYLLEEMAHIILKDYPIIDYERLCDDLYSKLLGKTFYDSYEDCYGEIVSVDSYECDGNVIRCLGIYYPSFDKTYELDGWSIEGYIVDYKFSDLRLNQMKRDNDLFDSD